VIGLNFGKRSHIADVITRAKFCANRFRDFGVLIPPLLPFFIGIAGRPYNSVVVSDVSAKIYFKVTVQLTAVTLTVDVRRMIAGTSRS